MRQWIQTSCWKCREENLVDNGDASDLTGVDVEGFVCWSCKSNNAFDDEGNGVETDEEQFDDGLPVPSKGTP